MSNLSLGTIEVLGLPAAVEAADVALKTANVQLIGYETTDGMGMVAVKIEGQVSAVQSAVAAARAAAEKITKVFAVSVIARPSSQLSPVVLTEATVGLKKTSDESAPVEPSSDESSSDESPAASEAEVPTSEAATSSTSEDEVPTSSTTEGDGSASSTDEGGVATDSTSPSLPPAPGSDASAKPANVPAVQADAPAVPADAPSGPPTAAAPLRSRGRKAPAAS